MINTSYHRLTLSAKDREVYDLLLDGFLNHDEKIIVPVPEEGMQEIFECVMRDQTQMFSVRAYTYHENRGRLVVVPNYLYSLDEYIQLRERCRTISKKMISGISGTDEEKARRVHDMMCRKMKYIDRGTESHSIVGPLLNHEGVCEGFSDLYKLLMDMLGVECITVLGGYKKFGEHLWNCVKIEDKWYHVDVTADICNSGLFVKRDYFLLSQEEIMKDHKAGRCLFKC